MIRSLALTILLDYDIIGFGGAVGSLLGVTAILTLAPPLPTILMALECGLAAGLGSIVGSMLGICIVDKLLP